MTMLAVRGRSATRLRRAAVSSGLGPEARLRASDYHVSARTDGEAGVRFVYAIQVRGQPWTKVGVANDVARRLSELRVSSPWEMPAAVLAWRAAWPPAASRR